MWILMDPVEDLVVPDDLDAAFDVHPGSREHWESFSPSSRKQMLAWIVMAKKPETRAVRVLTTAAKAALGEKCAVADVRWRSRRGRTPRRHPTISMAGWESAQARSSTCENASTGCAPETPYFWSTTKNGTPVAP